jgi:hypothetical protein
MNLIDHLSSLNSDCDDIAIWVNPLNPNGAYAVDSLTTTNADVTQWIFIGTLKDLSYGKPDYGDAMRLVASSWIADNSQQFFIECFAESIIRGIETRTIDPDLYSRIVAAIAPICADISRERATFFVTQILPQYIAESLDPSTATCVNTPFQTKGFN